MSILKSILDSIETKLKIASDKNLISEIEKAGNLMVTALKSGNKILIAGNGGSAADAQHFAAELAGKFIHSRKGLPAIALNTNSSIITAIGNDFEYSQVFSRQIEGLGMPGDIFLAISTSGNSENLIEGAKIANSKDVFVVGLLGKDGGNLKNYCNQSIIVPSSSTQIIQECHIMIIHAICYIIDEEFKGK